MSNNIKKNLYLLALIGALINLCGCSVFISTPRTAKISIQGLDNQYYEYVVPLDDPVSDNNLDIPITKHYAIQFDFEWLWESGSDNQLYQQAAEEDMIAPLSPWMLCKYRF